MRRRACPPTSSGIRRMQGLPRDCGNTLAIHHVGEGRGGCCVTVLEWSSSPPLPGVSSGLMDQVSSSPTSPHSSYYGVKWHFIISGPAQVQAINVPLNWYVTKGSHHLEMKLGFGPKTNSNLKVPFRKKKILQMWPHMCIDFFKYQWFTNQKAWNKRKVGF